MTEEQELVCDKTNEFPSSEFDLPVQRSFERLKVDSIPSPHGSRRSSLASSDGEILGRIGDFKSQAQELGKQITENFEAQFQDMVNSFTIENFGQKRKKRQMNDHDGQGNKIFYSRDSYLTELLEITHIQAIYNIFIALLFVFFLNTAVVDYFETGKILDLSLLSWALGDVSALIWNWVLLQSYALLLYPLFAAFTKNHLSNSPLPCAVWGVVYLAYVGYLMYFPVAAIYEYNLPPIASMVLTCEQVRFFMKIHAFVRVNSGKIMAYSTEMSKYKKDDDVESMEPFNLPGFSQYLYFLFIPTLIYRDSYPMKPSIRWNFVVMNLLQVGGCIFYAYFIIVRFAAPLFRKTGMEPGNLRTLLLSAFSCMLPAVMVLLVGFFCVLHSWFNAFGEMMRFGDRMFYRDWWNSNSFSSYYRMWNVVVHDWLYAYIYKDFLFLVGKKYRSFAATGVFMISAVVHEYILAFTFRFFYPALFLMFGGVGWIFFFLKPKKGNRNPLWNIYLWVSLCMGSGILMAMYSVEWYAKQNCNRPYTSWISYVLPYSFDSRCISWEWKSS